MLSDQRIVRAFDHYERHQINLECHLAFGAPRFNLNAIEPHIASRCKGLRENRSVIAGTHYSMRTESERLGK
jgi:hypothetical protein